MLGLGIKRSEGFWIRNFRARLSLPTGIVKARSNLLMSQIWKFSDDLIWVASFHEMAKDKAYRNSGPFDAKFAPQDIWCAFYVVVLCSLHFSSSDNFCFCYSDWRALRDLI
jgi:hypothetical protein